ncbi:9931_t:CDS:2, partial [Diversispora eburnea]
STVNEQPSNTVSALITSEEVDRKIQTAVALLENQKSESNKIRSDPNLYLNNAITKDMAELSLNLAKIKKSLRRCSNCNRTGHTSRTCSKKKRSRRKARVNHINKNNNSDSENDSSDSDSESGSSSEESEVEFDHSYDVKKEETKFQVSPSKFRKESQSKQTILEQTIRKIIRSELKEIIPPHLLQNFEPKFSSIRPAYVE